MIFAAIILQYVFRSSHPSVPWRRGLNHFLVVNSAKRDRNNNHIIMFSISTLMFVMSTILFTFDIIDIVLPLHQMLSYTDTQAAVAKNFSELNQTNLFLGSIIFTLEVRSSPSDHYLTQASTEVDVNPICTVYNERRGHCVARLCDMEWRQTYHIILRNNALTVFLFVAYLQIEHIIC